MNTTDSSASANVYFAGHPLPQTQAALQDAGAAIVENLDEADAVIAHGVSP